MVAAGLSNAQASTIDGDRRTDSFFTDFHRPSSKFYFLFANTEASDMSDNEFRITGWVLPVLKKESAVIFVKHAKRFGKRYLINNCVC